MYILILYLLECLKNSLVEMGNTYHVISFRRMFRTVRRPKNSWRIIFSRFSPLGGIG